MILWATLIAQAVPADLDVHVHRSITSRPTRRPRPPRPGSFATLGCTCITHPPDSSWLNLVERWFAELTRRLLQRSAHRSVRALEADLREWTATWNENPRPFVWRKTADEILESLAGYCQRISESSTSALARKSL